MKKSTTIYIYIYCVYCLFQNYFGLPLDDRTNGTKLDWFFWAASLANNKTTHAQYTNIAVNWANTTQPRLPMTDYFNSENGEYIIFQARPVVGGLFAEAIKERIEENREGG